MIEDSGYRRKVGRQYRELMEHCQSNLDKAQGTAAGREDFYASLKEKGISRRSFIKWTSVMTAALDAAARLSSPWWPGRRKQFSRVPVVWLHFAECTG